MMMTKKLQRKILLAAMACCVSLPITAASAAAPSDYSMDETVVTAMRYTTKNTETPADVTVISNEKLKSTGSKNLMEALKYTAGVTYYGYGPHGQSWGGMNSKLTIRGIEGGTLVLINGVSANLNGIYHLDQIPVDSVEKVEIVKGGGAVLYGSEAFGGVINIITKNKVENTVSVSNGSDRQGTAVTFQAEKSSISYEYSRTKQSEPFSDVLNPNSYKYLWRDSKTPVYMRDVFGASVQNNLNWNYQFDDHLRLLYMRNNNDYSVLYKEEGTGSILNNYHYNDQKQRVQLEYKENDWTSKLYYNGQRVDSTTVETARPNLVAWGKEKIATYGVDTQKVWESGDNKWLSGVTVQKETYEKQGQSLSGSTASTRVL
ncbi:MAG: TonB-dependent receptor plug domain-containing protein, partial [Sporomusaceae bacterium]|nr:TonB-dependent receptor plug domain-containing protein [Sporomusaceae bacterium]